jgi:hypothetical protein
MYRRSVFTSLVVFLVSSSSFAMVFDNRFMPLMSRPWIAPDDGRTHVSANAFVVRATNAYNKNGEQVPLPEIWGQFDLGECARNWARLGHRNSLKTEWQGLEIPWLVNGKFYGAGIDIEWQKFLFWHVWIGGSFMAMQLDSWYEYTFDERKAAILKDYGSELDEARRSVMDDIGFCGAHAHERGIGDIDFYIRLGNYWEYTCKFRSIQAGGRVGLLIPTAKPRNVKFPSSIPFGGDRHWGVYGALDAMFELKEDIKVGIYTRASQRFSHIECTRIPLGCGEHCEAENMAPMIGNVDVEPGATFVFSPFATFECLRDGLGARIAYTLTKHWHDTWNLWGVPNGFDREELGNRLDLEKMSKRTSWGSDYFSINVFYDFGKAKPDWTVYPILTFCWDIPASVLIANSVAKTDRVSLGVEVAF